MNALELISKERREQIEKHGYTADIDLQYPKGTLQNAATAILTDNEDYWPKGWDKLVFHHICGKPYQEQLAIAAALLAAEIDRDIAATDSN